jgi:multidrug transporter EmrE-like cation transporter
MVLAQLLAAALLFSGGGLFMKLSDGATKPAATSAFLAMVAAGAVMQALAMKRADLGPSYIFVLGAEAVITLVVSALYLHEAYTPSRLAAIGLVVAGISWLRMA